MGKYKGTRCYFCIMGIWIKKWLTNVPALRDPNQSDTNQYFFLFYLDKLYQSDTFYIFFLYISITFSLLPSFLKVEKAVFFYTATCWNHGSSSPFLNLNIHVCHLLSCLLFYKIKIVIGIQCNTCVQPENFWNNSNIFVFKNMSFLCAPSTSTHSQNNFCNASLLYLSLYLCFLSKPFTSDTTLAWEVSGVSKLPDSIPDNGCDSVLRNFYN